MSILGIWIRGVAMGAADVVPGVSGGTVAFLTGIYSRWLNVLTTIHPRLWGVYRKEGTAGLWRALDGPFVLPLCTGILMAVMLLSHWINDWLGSCPERVLGFFFGLVLAMGLSLLSEIRKNTQERDWVWSLSGFLIALVISFGAPEQVSPALWMWPFAGAMAFSAMLLPGISGSFLLLLTGFYPALIAAVSNHQGVILVLFVAGGAAGIVMMAHVLKRLLKSFEQQVLSILTGIVFGALVRVWPWQKFDPLGQLSIQTPSSETLLIPLACIACGMAIAYIGVHYGKSTEERKV